MIRAKFRKILHKKSKHQPKPIPQKPKIKPMKSRRLIESKGILLIAEAKEIEVSLKEFEKLDFLSEPEEQSRIKLLLEKTKLEGQIQILFWVLEMNSK